jgi:hypothetical protein
MYTFDVCLNYSNRLNFIFNSSCAFPNTPKFTQVQQSEKGFIVNKQWILDCYKQNQLISDKIYELKGNNNSTISTNTPRRTSERKPINFDDDDDEEENEEPLVSKDVKRKTPIKKKIATFDDDDDDDDDEEPIVSKSVQTKSPPKKKTTTFDDDDQDGIIDFLIFLHLIGNPQKIGLRDFNRDLSTIDQKKYLEVR